MSPETDSFEDLEESVGYDAGNVYSEAMIEHTVSPRNMGEMSTADGYAKVTGPCGDTIQFCLRVGGDRITDAKFMTTGCAPSVACGSIATELIIGRTVAEALGVTQDDILENLGDLPESEVHCARLAVTALAQALRDCISLRREPWKKAYRAIEPFQASL